MKKINYEGWNIDRDKYPLEKINNNDIITILVDDFAPSMEVIFYKKNNINLFYFRHGTICWQSINWNGEISIYKVFKSVFKTIDTYVKNNKIKGELGFELSGLNKLDKAVEYLLNKNGYKTEIKNGVLFVESISRLVS